MFAKLFSRNSFFFPQNLPLTLHEDITNLEDIISRLKKWDNTKGSWFYQYAVPTIGWVTWGGVELYWFSTEINALLHPAWTRRNEQAWNQGHTDYVNFTHYDCSHDGHYADIHRADSQFDFGCMAGPISRCCELTNGPNFVTAIGVTGLFIGMGVNSILGQWGYSYAEDKKNQTIDIPEQEHSRIIQLIQEDILDKYNELPLAKQPTPSENIQALTENLQQFKTNPVKAEVIVKMISLVGSILSDMQKTQLSLSKEETTEEYSDENAELLKNVTFI